MEISENRILDFLHPLPVSEIWGVGPKINEVLLNLGLQTVADLANTPKNTLIRALGSALGEHLHELSWGRDFREVENIEIDKSISAAETFDVDIDDEEEWFGYIGTSRSACICDLCEKSGKVSPEEVVSIITRTDFKTQKKHMKHIKI